MLKRETHRAGKHRRKARLRGNGGSYTPAEWIALKTQYDNRCLVCGKQEPEIELTVDHIIPLAKGGPNTINNIQPLCHLCNSLKGTDVKDYRPKRRRTRTAWQQEELLSA
jgi:5-methylcytosine-specific restriction enzyme A